MKEYYALIHGKFPWKSFKCTHPLGSHKVSPSFLKQAPSRPATTVFEMAGYCGDTDTSLLKCFLYTGRTHQIRLHLQHLGFFIVNDPLYRPEDSSLTMEQDDYMDLDNLSRILDKMESADHSDDINDTYDKSDTVGSVVKRFAKYKFCVHCQNPKVYPFPSLREMCLHSHKYNLGDGETYQSEPPDWATNATVIVK